TYFRAFGTLLRNEPHLPGHLLDSFWFFDWWEPHRHAQCTGLLQNLLPPPLLPDSSLVLRLDCDFLRLLFCWPGLGTVAAQGYEPRLLSGVLPLFHPEL